MRTPLQRLQRDVEALSRADDALARLDAGRRLRQRAEAVELDLVAAARAEGVSWTRIGALYGMSKQGAQQRFRPGARKQRPDGEGAADG